VRQCLKPNVERTALKEATESGQVLTTSGGLAKTASLTVGLTQRRGRILTDISRKDERRDRFLRKKKFKKITTASKLKETKRKEPKLNLNREVPHGEK
tara:strand:+ start:60 stop:353 length:294 start_codon:yes stop_codon:yes gene_type:complete